MRASDGGGIEDDDLGALAASILASAGHEVVERTVVDAGSERFRRVVHHWLDADVQAVLVVGGTELWRSESSIEIVRGAVEKPLPGFGEFLRQAWFESHGAGAVAVRAFAGIATGKVVFVIPGSTAAVEFALRRLVLPGLATILEELRSGPHARV